MTRENDAAVNSTQADKFRDLARELECDEDVAAFEEKVRKVASRKPDAAKDRSS